MVAQGMSIEPLKRVDPEGTLIFLPPCGNEVIKVSHHNASRAPLQCAFHHRAVEFVVDGEGVAEDE